jgi:hypothetical protein
MAFDANSKIKDILANEEAKAVLDKHLPGFSKDPQTKMASGMTLKAISSFPQAKVVKDKLPEILADLAKIA